MNYIVMGFASFLFIFLLRTITTIPAGNLGVVDVFGSVRSEPIQAGLNFIHPMATVIQMSIRTQIITVSEDVPTKEGLDVHLEAAVLVALDADRVVEMYINVGQDYMETAVVPQFRSVLRSITSGHDAKDLYASSTREAMGESLHSELSLLLSPRGITVQEVLLKKLELPARLHDAIEQKLQAEQASQQMQFVLDKQRQEAQRMTIEANAIAEYQRIVSTDITENLLRWKGIEATLQIAQSPNAKVVVIGSGTQGGLPVILNPSADVGGDAGVVL